MDNLIFSAIPGNEMQKKTSILLAVISILYGAIVSVVLVEFPKKGDRTEIVGSACVIFGVLMYAAPLSVMVNKLPYPLIQHCWIKYRYWYLIYKCLVRLA